MLSTKFIHGDLAPTNIMAKKDGTITSVATELGSAQCSLVVSLQVWQLASSSWTFKQYALVVLDLDGLD